MYLTKALQDGIDMYVYICKFAYMYVYVCTHTYMCICIYVHMYMYMYMYTTRILGRRTRRWRRRVFVLVYQ